MRPPFTVLLLAVLGVIEGILAALLGIGVIVERDDPEIADRLGYSSGWLIVYGIVAIGIGVVIAWLAIAVAQRSSFARWTLGFLAVVHLAGGLFTVFQWYDVNPWQGVGSIVVSAVVLYLLFWARSTRNYFAAPVDA
jgi:hypothetical protein